MTSMLSLCKGHWDHILFDLEFDFILFINSYLVLTLILLILCNIKLTLTCVKKYSEYFTKNINKLTYMIIYLL